MRKITQKLCAVAAALMLTACGGGETAVIQQEIGDSIEPVDSEIELAYDKLDFVNTFLSSTGEMWCAATLNGESEYIGLADKEGLSVIASLINVENEDLTLGIYTDDTYIYVSKDNKPIFEYEICAFGENSDFDTLIIACMEEALVANGCAMQKDDRQVIALDNVSLSNSLQGAANLISLQYQLIYDVTKDDTKIAEEMNEVLDNKYDISAGISSDMLNAYLTAMLDKADKVLLDEDNAFYAEITFIDGGIKIDFAGKENTLQLMLVDKALMEETASDESSGAEG